MKYASLIVAIIFLTASMPARIGVPADETQYHDTDIPSSRAETLPCVGTYWTPRVDWNDSTFDETSTTGVAPGCNLITIAYSGNNDPNGTDYAVVRIFEVPASGSQILKYYNTIYSDGSGNPSPGGWSIANGSKLRLLVTTNTGLEMVFQFNAG